MHSSVAVKRKTQMPDDSIAAIRERLAVIDAELPKHEAAVAALRAERSELEVAERVVLRLQGDKPAETPAQAILRTPRKRKVVNGHDPRAVSLTRRLHVASQDQAATPPPGLPTNSEMVIAALEYAKENALI